MSELDNEVARYLGERGLNIVPMDNVAAGAKKKVQTGFEQDVADGIVPPQMHELVKSSKIKGEEIELMKTAIEHGINPVTDPKKFLQQFGATAEQQGIARSWGPLENVRELLFPDVQSAKARQQGLLQVGTFLTQKMLDLEASRLGAPKTIGEAESALPGLVPFTPEQRANTITGPVPEFGKMNPATPLLPWQQDVASTGLKSLGAGHLMLTSEGIVPTTYAQFQGRMITPQQAGELQSMAGIQDPYNPTVNLPSSSVSSVIDAKTRLQKPADLNNALESLTYIESAKRFGRAMNFRQVSQLDPEFAAQLRTQAEIVEKKNMYEYNQDQQMKRMIAQAGPVVTAQQTAQMNMPVADPQLWRDPVTGKAANPRQSERQVRDEQYVKLRPDQVETVNQLTTIDDGLAELKTLSKGLFSPAKGSEGGDMLRALGQVGYLAWLRARGDKRVVKMDSIITRMTAPLVKSQGDTANIAVAEREMFAKSLVNNQASLEAVLGNLDNLSDVTKKSRGMMGFKSREEFVQGLLDQGMSHDQIRKILEKKGIPSRGVFSAAGALHDTRATIQDLIRQGKTDAEIQAALGEK